MGPGRVQAGVLCTPCGLLACIVLAPLGHGAGQGLPKPEHSKHGWGSASRSLEDPTGGGGQQAPCAVSRAGAHSKRRCLETLCLWVGTEEQVAGEGLSDEGSVQLMREGGGVGAALQLTCLGLKTGGWARGRRRDCHTEGAGMSPSGPLGTFQRIRVGCWCQAGWRGVLRWGKLAEMGQVREGETISPAGAPRPRAGADGGAEPEAAVGGGARGTERVFGFRKLSRGQLENQ